RARASVHHRPLHPVPTRRSSDLSRDTIVRRLTTGARQRLAGVRVPPGAATVSVAARSRGIEARLAVEDERGRVRTLPLRPRAWRSEEHTSELQSRFELVCRLLLE